MQQKHPANNPKKDASPSVVLRGETAELYEGPIPHPDILAKFGAVDSTFPDRIMKMAEKHADANIRSQDRASRSNSIVPVLGQIFMFLLGGRELLQGFFLHLEAMKPEA